MTIRPFYPLAKLEGPLPCVIGRLYLFAESLIVLRLRVSIVDQAAIHVDVKQVSARSAGSENRIVGLCLARLGNDEFASVYAGWAVVHVFVFGQVAEKGRIRNSTAGGCRVGLTGAA